MEVSDLLFVTESDVDLEIRESDEYQNLLWEGTVGEINFSDDIPYGNYEICRVAVDEKRSILQIFI
jgi:hypothetical protein